MAFQLRYFTILHILHGLFKNEKKTLFAIHIETLKKNSFLGNKGNQGKQRGVSAIESTPDGALECKDGEIIVK